MSGWRAGVLGVVGLLVWSGCGEREGGRDSPVKTAPEQVEPDARGPEQDVGPRAPAPEDLEHETAWTPGSVRWTVDEQAPGRQDVVAVAADGERGFVLLGTSELPAAPDARAERDSTSLRVSGYSAEGTPRWTRTFTPEPGDHTAGDLHAWALAVSPSGDIFVLARVKGRLRWGDTLVEDTAFLMKLSARGAPRWVLPQADMPQQQLAADGLGGVVVLNGLTVTRHDSAGAPSWSWTSAVPMGFRAMAADAAGGALLAGAKQVDPYTTHGVIVRLSEQGTERWRLSVGPDGPSFTGAAIHSDGSIVLVGASMGRFQWGTDVVETPCQANGCYNGVVALAMDAEGRPRWSRMLESLDQSGSYNPRVTLDAQGSAALVWDTAWGSRLGRLSSSGADLWRAAYDNPPGTCGAILQAVTFLPGGALMGAGTRWGTCPRPEGGFLTTNEEDLFLQRLNP